jgi:SAM-dependent methyltransferase
MIARRPSGSLVIDVAPSGPLSSSIRQMARANYIALDLDPAADGRLVDVRASLTLLPIRDGQVGLLVCSHVLEHIPDDRAALAEIFRVLHPSGVALIQVPRRRGSPTDEDPTVPIDERIRRFGQADHVRYYGDDFEDRLAGAGLRVFPTDFRRILSPSVLTQIGADKSEEIWLASRQADPEAYLRVDESVAALAQAVLPPTLTRTTKVQDLNDIAQASIDLLMLAEESGEARADAAHWRSEAAIWRSRHIRMLGHPYVRFGMAVRRRIKRVSTSLRR